jgi:hypothetical protein
MKTPVSPTITGNSRPTSTGEDGTVYVPPPSWKRYYGYVADAYWALDEARKRKQEWYDRRDEWVADVRQNKMPNAEDADRLTRWGSTIEGKDLAALEQWAQRQVMQYTAMAELEYRRLRDAGIPDQT